VNRIAWTAWLLLLSLNSSISAARPVSYTGGLTLIEESDRQSTSLLVHFTPAPQWSIGLRGEHNRDQDYALYTLHPLCTPLGLRSVGLERIIKATFTCMVESASQRVLMATPSARTSRLMVA